MFCKPKRTCENRIFLKFTCPWSLAQACAVHMIAKLGIVGIAVASLWALKAKRSIVTLFLAFGANETRPAVTFARYRLTCRGIHTIALDFTIFAECALLAWSITVISFPAIFTITLSRFWITFAMYTATFLLTIAVIAIFASFLAFVAAETGLAQTFPIDWRATSTIMTVASWCTIFAKRQIRTVPIANRSTPASFTVAPSI